LIYDSKLHLLQVFGHLAGADVIDVLLLVVCVVDALVDALLEFALIKLHGEHVGLHLLL
jgi:hypothetical protein